MFLTGHAVVGAILSSGTNNPALAFGLGWLSHYAADFFPHGDEPLGEWAKKGNEVKRLLFIVGIDAAILAGLAAAYFFKKGFSLPMFFGAMGATVPDILWGLEKLSGKKLFGAHERFHGRNHNFFRLRLPYRADLALQLLVTATLWVHLL